MKNNGSVRNFRSPRSGAEVANQFIISTNDGRFFQSYDSVVAFIPYGDGKTQLDERYWNYSRTTAKYRNEFLGMTTKETERAIKNGEIELTNLN